MSKIEAFKIATNLAGRIAGDVSRSLGRDSPSNDKHTAVCRFAGISNNSFSPILLSVDLSYGYYGSSSGYSATSEELGRYLAAAITKRMSSLLDECVDAAKVDAEKARKDAEAEAQAVLAETA